MTRAERRRTFRTARVIADYTQTEAAKRAKISYDRYMRIENGKVNPTPAEWAKLERVLAVERSDVDLEAAS